MGTCIPKEILGPAGYLALKQSSLESITLITDSECGWDEADPPSSNPIDLSKFHALRQIAWFGFHTRSDLRTLCVALEANSKLLTHLQLGSVQDWWNEDTDDEDEEADETGFSGENNDNNGIIKDSKSLNSTVRRVFGLNEPTTAPSSIFPALQSLSLAFFPLEGAENTLVNVLNTARLSHLALRSCPGMEGFLRALAASNETIKLTSLHFSCALMEDEDWCEALECLFRVAPALTDIFLSIPRPNDALDFWTDLAGHHLPLTRFVYHQKSFRDENSGIDDLEPLEDKEWLEDHATEDDRHPLIRLNSIRCLGLCADPSFAV